LDAGGAPAAIVHCREDGQLVLNNGGGTAVEFARLKIAFDQLKADFDALVDFINGAPGIGHTHTCPAGGGMTTAMTGTGSHTSADIDPSESPTIEVP
jgi:hypothetical protein